MEPESTRSGRPIPSALHRKAGLYPSNSRTWHWDQILFAVHSVGQMRSHWWRRGKGPGSHLQQASPKTDNNGWSCPRLGHSLSSLYKPVSINIPTPQLYSCAHHTHSTHRKTYTQPSTSHTLCTKGIISAHTSILPAHSTSTHTECPSTTLHPHLPLHTPTSTHLLNMYSHLPHTYSLIHSHTHSPPSQRNERSCDGEVVRHWGQPVLGGEKEGGSVLLLLWQWCETSPSSS